MRFVIFNIISIISSEQFRPEDRPKQLSLFDEEFETENNIFALLKSGTVSEWLNRRLWKPMSFLPGSKWAGINL